MKRFFLAVTVLIPCLVFSQPKNLPTQYPSLLWEISGNGLAKPSYLFGTMHVSNKLAFQLSDSFYIGIKNADVVALETNPEFWQEEMTKYGDGFQSQFSARGNYVETPQDYFTIKSLQFKEYFEKIEFAFSSDPPAINSLLYRTERGNDDYEEDTFLDMYIYQCGKRWGKKIAGVEGYAESMRLVSEAYRDAALDKNRKPRRYFTEDGYSLEHMQEAYRTGNLDLLDSINKYNSLSDAFDEKFIYKRNEIQANSIDSILKSKATLFVGVGAAHLPGNRGVIEMLRKMGYRLRPIKMQKRDGFHKSSVEKLRVPVKFSTQFSDDSLFQVDLPGRLYTFGYDPFLDQRQYADMANGSYYMVTRVTTHSWMWNHSPADVFRKVDSLLYENVPGKILSKKIMEKNGFRGFDITSRTRRGDVQRYNIFITPFEILIYKISGTGDYVLNGTEADKFVNSIKFRPYVIGDKQSANVKYSPSFGGFAVSFPHTPYVSKEDNWVFDASDRNANLYFRVIRTDIHNHHFSGVDSFDLNMMEESFSSSDFIKKLVSRKSTQHQGYPALDCKYIDISGNIYLTRFILRGANYYTLIAKGKTDDSRLKQFIESFELRPLNYRSVLVHKDSLLYFSVSSPYYPYEQEKFDIPAYDYANLEMDAQPENEKIKSGFMRTKVVSNDTTGEKIYVHVVSSDRYIHLKDSNFYSLGVEPKWADDNLRIVRFRKEFKNPSNFSVIEKILSDTLSSRAHWVKGFYKDGIGHFISTQIDTVSKPSTFLQNFFDSYTPVDTIAGTNPFVSKSKSFLEDFMSHDSVRHNRAINGMFEIEFDSTDLEMLKEATRSLNWKTRKYLDVKKMIIGKFSDIKTKEATNFLKNLYYASGDTVEMQHAILNSIVNQKTSYAFHTFSDVMTNEPPVISLPVSMVQNSYDPYSSITSLSGIEFINGLYDSLTLTKTILPQLLTLLNLHDYEEPLRSLLAVMVDSSIISGTDYNQYLNKFSLEARHELKKQKIAEKTREIFKAEQAKDPSSNSFQFDSRIMGNKLLSQYATLLSPFIKSEESVRSFLYQLLQSSDKSLRFETAELLLRNGNTVHDTIIQAFAKDDLFRYKLYLLLKKTGGLSRFPGEYLNQQEIAKSLLLQTYLNERPDSIVFLDKRSIVIAGLTGNVYFFRYKMTKDDVISKIAVAGIMPADSTRMLFEDKEVVLSGKRYNQSIPHAYYLKFNQFTEQKLDETESIDVQLEKALRRLIYLYSPSGKEFYRDEPWDLRLYR